MSKFNHNSVEQLLATYAPHTFVKYEKITGLTPDKITPRLHTQIEKYKELISNVCDSIQSYIDQQTGQSIELKEIEASEMAKYSEKEQAKLGIIVEFHIKEFQDLTTEFINKVIDLYTPTLDAYYELIKADLFNNILRTQDKVNLNNFSSMEIEALYHARAEIHRDKANEKKTELDQALNTPEEDITHIHTLRKETLYAYIKSVLHTLTTPPPQLTNSFEQVPFFAQLSAYIVDFHNIITSHNENEKQFIYSSFSLIEQKYKMMMSSVQSIPQNIGTMFYFARVLLGLHSNSFLPIHAYQELEECITKEQSEEVKEQLIIIQSLLTYFVLST